MNKEAIMQQIDDLVAKQTFSLDALEGIKKIKDTLAETIAERDAHKASEENHRRVANDLAAKVSSMGTELNAALATINCLEADLKAARDAVWEKKIAEASAMAYRDAMGIVFKPHAVRESVLRNHTVVVPSSGGAGYTQTVQNQDNIVKEDL